jgi:hypothetical protein
MINPQDEYDKITGRFSQYKQGIDTFSRGKVTRR